MSQNSDEFGYLTLWFKCSRSIQLVVLMGFIVFASNACPHLTVLPRSFIRGCRVHPDVQDHRGLKETKYDMQITP